MLTMRVSAGPGVSVKIGCPVYDIPPGREMSNDNEDLNHERNTSFIRAERRRIFLDSR